MAKLNIAPTKSNLLAVKEQLTISMEGYDLLEQKREILVMELMRIVEQVKLLENQMDKCISSAYPSLKQMLMAVGGDRVERIGHGIDYDFELTSHPVSIAGIGFTALDVNLPRKQLFSSIIGSFADCDKVVNDFFELLTLSTQMASIRTIAWRLAIEVRKTQRRVNALDKMVIPQNMETAKYIEGVLEERERENIFVVKALKKGRSKND